MFHILCPLQTQENLRFSGIFREDKMGTMTRNGLMKQPVSSLHSQYKIKQKQSLLTISKVDLNNRLKVDIHLYNAAYNSNCRNKL